MTKFLFSKVHISLKNADLGGNMNISLMEEIFEFLDNEYQKPC